MESEVTILNRARNEFMSGLTNDTSEMKNITQNFIPAIILCIQVAEKIVGRDKVVNTIVKNNSSYS